MSKQLSFDFSKERKTLLSGKEKIFLYTSLFVLLVSLTVWSFRFYLNSTQKIATVGGEFTEGLIGSPQYINPILTQLNETDATISRLIFSSLMTYDENGNLINDLTENYEISDEGRRYKIKIREDAFWHDETPLTAQDVFFTINLIQSQTKNPFLKADWLGIETELEGEYTLIFKLQKAHSPFLNKLTFGILPEKIFKNISSENFLLTKFNLEPIGSGPFEFSYLEKNDKGAIISYQLTRNEKYYRKNPYLERINFNFYNTEDELIEAYNKKKINGFGLFSYDKINELAGRKDTQIKNLKMPQHFAIFLNKTESWPFSQKEVRQALTLATDRQEIIEKVFLGYAQPSYSPIIKEFGQFQSQLNTDEYNLDIEKAKKILLDAGWKPDENGILKKDDRPLEISLITANWEITSKTTDLIKSQWEKIGAKVNTSSLEYPDLLENYLKPRTFESLLFGQEYSGNEPDPYSFWHSTRKKDPGKNLAIYDNASIDKLLEELREEDDLEKRKERYADFEKVIAKDYPAIFLYSPEYIYILNSKIKGFKDKAIINRTYRLSNISEWFIKTNRTKKPNPGK